ncbi:outer membrane beta-barrel protein [Adhaeribacter sp. BT258]|uniref:Outer membrane beta-barrel protein n=1 Tax=Adhaeribacter terrigena TaxID=2793070 RepID=A0ABS1C2H8_9BACT|nr:outer membrane beta-barrel protein [Adhaeribacter terrigena]MBK0403606.1 outer membrane beta-barrel protein [Adhaeribacter terrigena]
MRNFSFLKLACVTTFFFSFAAISSEAQNKYIKLSGSYHLGLDSNPANAGSGNINSGGSTTRNERVGINYGKGAVYNVALGYMFNGNIGVEMGLGYLKGRKLTTESRYYYPEYYITETNNYETYSRMTLLQPAVVLTTGSGKLKPYAKLGMLLAFGTIYEKQYDALYDLSREISAEYSGGYGFGFQSAAGLTLQANENIDFFMEFTMHNLSYAPEKWMITGAKENGADMMYKYEREVSFSDEFFQDYNAKGEPTKITEAHRIHLPMSTVGLGFGMKVNF